MSVDTYLKGKDTSRYVALEHDGARVLLSPALVRWAGRVELATRPGLFRQRFAVYLEHRHTAACQH